MCERKTPTEAEIYGGKWPSQSDLRIDHHHRGWNPNVDETKIETTSGSTVYCPNDGSGKFYVVPDDKK